MGLQSQDLHWGSLGSQWEQKLTEILSRGLLWQGRHWVIQESKRVLLWWGGRLDSLGLMMVPQ